MHLSKLCVTFGYTPQNDYGDPATLDFYNSTQPNPAASSKKTRISLNDFSLVILIYWSFIFNEEKSKPDFSK